MPRPCLQCGTRGVCPACRERARERRSTLGRWAGAPAPVPQPAAPSDSKSSAVATTTESSQSDGRGPEQAEDPAPAGESQLAAVDRAVGLTQEIVGLETLLMAKRRQRRTALRHATTGPDAVPVAQIAKRLGMSRERVYKLLR